ncbi:MAG TPA: Uma2 family endonuclease [Humisphaera sp.]
MSQRGTSSNLSEAPLVEPARLHRFSLEDYLRMSELGLFEAGKVEFIAGEVIDVPPQKNLHSSGVTRARKWADRAFDDRTHWVRVQMTLQVGQSLPDPDVAVLDFPDTADDSFAGADRALLVIEVSDTTLLADTSSKMSLYASGGVADYWVLSIPDRTLIVHREPVRAASARHGWAYADVKRHAPGQSVAPLAAPSAPVDPADWLP